MALLVVLLASGLAHTLADVAVSLTALVVSSDVFSAAVVVALYAFTIALIGAAAVFPFTVHAEFILERRFGLSRQRIVDWLRGQAQITVAHVIVWMVGAVLAYAFMRRWPDWWWLVGGLVFGLLTIAVTHIAPVVTLPLLYRSCPIGRPELRARLETLVRRVGAPVTAIHEWKLGSDAPRPNAALVGIGPTLRVLLTDALLADYSDDEIEVVLAHELAHYVHRDVWKTLAFETVVATLACGAAHWALFRVGPLLGLSGPTDVAGFPVVILAGGAVVVVVLTPVANLLSREHERRADQYALAVTGKPEALASGLRRLAVQSLAEERPSRVVEWLFYTHPPLSARLGAAHAAMGAHTKTVSQSTR